MRIAYITSRFPFPLEKGDKLRAYQQIMLLKAMGHEVYLFAMSDVPVDAQHMAAVKRICHEVNVYQLSRSVIFKNVARSFLCNESVQSFYFYSRKVHQLLKQRIHDLNPDVMFFQLIRTARYAEGFSRFPKVLDYQDAFSKGMQQRSNKSRFIGRWIFGREARLLEKYEKRCLIEFDGTSIITNSDRISIDSENKHGMAIIPNFIALDHFVIHHTQRSNDVLFVGNMGYPPNVEAASFLVNEIMPKVWQILPDIKVLLAGANPSSKIKNLASDKVVVTGWVDDIRDCYQSSQLFVAPMLSGTGLQNKLLESLAMGLPCITSTLCASTLAPGYEELVSVGSNADQFAFEIIQHFQCSQDYTQYGINSRKYIAENYDSKTIGDHLEGLLKKAMVNHDAAQKSKP